MVFVVFTELSIHFLAAKFGTQIYPTSMLGPAVMRWLSFVRIDVS